MIACGTHLAIDAYRSNSFDAWDAEAFAEKNPLKIQGFFRTIGAVVFANGFSRDGFSGGGSSRKATLTAWRASREVFRMVWETRVQKTAETVTLCPPFAFRASRQVGNSDGFSLGDSFESAVTDSEQRAVESVSMMPDGLLYRDIVRGGAGEEIPEVGSAYESTWGLTLALGFIPVVGGFDRAELSVDTSNDLAFNVTEGNTHYWLSLLAAR